MLCRRHQSLSMGSVQLPDVFTPHCQRYNAYRHYLFFEQCRILPLCRTIRHAPVSCNFRHKMQNVAVQSRHNSPRSFTSESYFAAREGFCNGLESDRLIADLTSKGLYVDAVKFYLGMLDKGFTVSEFSSFPILVKAIGVVSELPLTRQIHDHLIKLGAIVDIYVANSLLSTFWKCGASDDAIRMFMKMEDKDSDSWNTLISGFQYSGSYHKSLEMFRSMISESGIYPNRVACLSALSSCASLKSVVRINMFCRY